jgi:hypothetical protein
MCKKARKDMVIYRASFTIATYLVKDSSACDDFQLLFSA